MPMRGSMLQFMLLSILAIAAGCQSVPVATGDPWVDDPLPVQFAGLTTICPRMVWEAAVWGTLPSAWCPPPDPLLFWSRPGIGYSRYAWGMWRPWRHHPAFTRGGIPALTATEDTGSADSGPDGAADKTGRRTSGVRPTGARCSALRAGTAWRPPGSSRPRRPVALEMHHWSGGWPFNRQSKLRNSMRYGCVARSAASSGSFTYRRTYARSDQPCSRKSGSNHSNTLDR